MWSVLTIEELEEPGQDMPYSDRFKAQAALGVNVASLLFVLILLFVFKNHDSAYFRFGPHPGLHLVIITIDTGTRYTFMVLALFVLGVSEVVVNEVGEPMLNFRIYNPYAGSPKEPITEFTRRELHFLGNAMYFVSHLRFVFTVVSTVTQIDLALWGVLFKEGASVVTVWYLLKGKTFEQDETQRFESLDESTNDSEMYDLEEGQHALGDHDARVSRRSRPSHVSFGVEGDDYANGADFITHRRESLVPPPVPLPPPPSLLQRELSHANFLPPHSSRFYST